MYTLHSLYSKHMELCSVLRGGLDGRAGLWGEWMDTCTCIAESLVCSSETITTLLIGCTPIQNRKFKKRKGVKMHYHLQKIGLNCKLNLPPITRRP